MSDNLNWDGSVPPDSQVDDVVDEALGYTEEEEQGADILNEAIERIEQAKLYESLIKHDFFAPGSARPEIQTRVTREIRGFILERLEILLGIKAPKEVEARVDYEVISQFDDEEVGALKEIAGRLIQKARTTGTTYSEPQVKQFHSQQPESQPNRVAPTTPKVNQVRAPQAAKQATRPAQKQSPKAQPSAPALAQMTPEERLSSGIYKPQAVSKTNPPKPMPNQMQINAMNAAEVAKRQLAAPMGISDQILRLAISSSQETNSGIVETLNDLA